MSREKTLNAAILAAGKSKRMNSRKSKVLHKIAGKPILFYPLTVARGIEPHKIFVIIGGPHADDIRSSFDEEDITFVEQPEPRGTGDAVMRLAPFFEGVKADLLVMPGDAPLLRVETAKKLARFHREKGASATVLTTELPDPTGYGRIIRSSGDRILMIVEEADAFPEEKDIKEVNSGIYIFDTEVLFRWLPEVRPDNKQGEYYLTDVIAILQRRVGGVYAYKIQDWTEVLGVNDRRQLSMAQEVMEKRIINKWMERGVTFLNPDQVYIEYDVELGKDCVIYPFVSLLGKTRVKDGVEIGPNVVLRDEEVGFDENG